jgi:hypothetical protein
VAEVSFRPMIWQSLPPRTVSQLIPPATPIFVGYALEGRCLACRNVSIFNFLTGDGFLAAFQF